MMVLKFKRRIEINKRIGNIYLETFHYGSYDENNKPTHWTELHCWYECDCEYCPLCWEDRGYEGACNDCGCYMAEYGEDYPKTVLICMLPRWIKKILLKHKTESDTKKLSWLGKNCKDCGNEKCKSLGKIPKGYDCALWQPEARE